MGTPATNERQFTFIYHSDSVIGKQTLGYVHGSGARVQAVDISKTRLGDNVWLSIAEGLNKSLGELLEVEDSDGAPLNTSDLSTTDCLKHLNHNPGLLKHPIAIKGNKYMEVRTPSDVLKFFEVDSAGLEKKPLGDKPVTKSKSDKDTFI